jgi:hypothetical protein
MEVKYLSKKNVKKHIEPRSNNKAWRIDLIIKKGLYNNIKENNHLIAHGKSECTRNMDSIMPPIQNHWP